MLYPNFLHLQIVNKMREHVHHIWAVCSRALEEAAPADQPLCAFTALTPSHHTSSPLSLLPCLSPSCTVLTHPRHHPASATTDPSHEQSQPCVSPAASLQGSPHGAANQSPGPVALPKPPLDTESASMIKLVIFTIAPCALPLLHGDQMQPLIKHVGSPCITWALQCVVEAAAQQASTPSPGPLPSLLQNLLQVAAQSGNSARVSNAADLIQVVLP